jgi:hypothetical protein
MPLHVIGGMIMSKVPLHFKYPSDRSYVYNGTRASAGVMANDANSVFGQPVCVASASYTLTNAPILRGITPAATSNSYQSTLKLRSDIPVILNDSVYYSGAKSSVKASAIVVIYNASAEPQSFTIPTVYQGDPATGATYWKLENDSTIYIPGVSAVTVNLNGYIYPMYRNNTKISDAVLNYVFFDAKTVSSASAMTVLYFALYMSPMAGIDSDSHVVPPTPVHSYVTSGSIQNYLDKLYDVNSSYNLFSHGTLSPVDNYTDKYGFSLNAYYATRKYHLFQPNTVYDSTTQTAGSLYVPLQGQGTLCSDGNYRYNIRMNWYSRCSASVTLNFYPLYFLPDSTAGVALSTITQAHTANTDYLITGVNTIVSATELVGIALCPRVQRSGTTANTYIYSSLFSAKVLPYPEYYS